MPIAPESPGLETRTAAAAESSRWPRVVGTIGIIAAVLMFIDKLDDLLMLPLLRSSDWWAGMLGEEIAVEVVRWMPPSAWIVAGSLVGMTLAILLLIGASRLRGRRRSGVALCRTWSWLAIAWLAVEVSGSLWWVAGRSLELHDLAPVDWGVSALFAIVVILALFAALPVFLLSWFARPGIKTQFAGWPQ